MKIKNLNPFTIWLYFIAIGVLSALTWMVYTALSHRPDMVTEQYYEQGLKEESILRYHRNATNTQFQIQITDSSTWSFIAQIKGLNIKSPLQVHYYRPSEKKLDQNLMIVADSNGVYHSPALQKGEWKMEITTHLAADTLLLEKEFYLK